MRISDWSSDVCSSDLNRIFGFDGWNRETVSIQMLGEPNLGKDKYGNDQWRVNYMAKVRITVGGVLREGCGFGQGIDKDVGQAHESAIKESERSEEHTSELQSLMRISYAVFCLKK